MFRFALLLVCLGVFVGYLGIKETRLWLGSKGTPTSITVEELERNGPGDNNFLEVKDFLLTPSFVYTMNSKDKSRYTAAYMPVVSIKSDYAKTVATVVADQMKNKVKDIKLPGFSGKFPLLIKSTKVHNEGEFEDLANADSVEGLVINSVESLGGKERDFLHQQFPGVDFDKVVLLEHGRQPTGVLLLLVYFGGSVLLMGAGVGVGLTTLSKAGQNH